MLLVVTGGTGSLSRAILRQEDILKKNNITKIRLISRDEIKQFHLEQSYSGSIPIQCVLGDVRSMERMRMALAGAEYFIHAAALKIVPKIEYDVPEAIRTNLGGTENVLRCFLEEPTAVSGMFISTDKAVDPLNAYGMSKAMAERLWLWGMMIQNRVKLGVCRYGNVFGSRGSVVAEWDRMLDDPNTQLLPITTTDMTRFFIKLDDAARFVLGNLFNNDGGEISIPKMKATEMTELAEVMIRNSGRIEVGLKETGIREGEKVHEVLTSVNDKVIYERMLPMGDDSMRLRPLTPAVTCYKTSRVAVPLKNQVGSRTAPRFERSELYELYQTWKAREC